MSARREIDTSNSGTKTPYYIDDPLMDEVRRTHRAQHEPADSDMFQLYTGSCSGCDWTSGPLNASAVQEAFDDHMAGLQTQQHAKPASN
jgi:hypothetical protein